MGSRNRKGFEFRLGTFGLILFTFGISILILVAFVVGVEVGKNINTYPQKIARILPEALNQPSPSEKSPKDPDKNERTASGTAKEEKLKLTFYDSLTKKTTEPPTVTSRESNVNASSTTYTVQVASFKDRKAAKALEEKLRAMKYLPVIDDAPVGTSGRWYRLKIKGFISRDEAKKEATSLEKKIRGIKCLILKDSP